MKKFVFGFIALIGLCGSQSTARAAFLDSSNPNASELQLESWLGQGNLSFTQVFSHTAGDGKTSANFHSSVDGKGATIVLLTAVVGSDTFLIGGYNPVSWRSDNTFTTNATDTGRTAFVFNLTTGLKLNQNLQASGGDGFYQTYNTSTYGPYFGSGPDLYLDSTLNAGFAHDHSYGEGSTHERNVFGFVSGGHTVFTATQFEVYTFAPTSAIAAPEPTSMTLLGIGSAVSLLGYRLRRRKAEAEATTAA